MKEVFRSLEDQRKDFANRRFLATPLTGMIIWTIVGLSGIFFSPFIAVWTIFIGTGCIVYLGLFLSKFTGENFMDRTKPKNEFDTLFMFTAGQAILVYSLAIPFFLVDYTSLPMTLKVKEFVIMGGQFPEGKKEWNFDGNMQGVTKRVTLYR